MFDEGDAVEIGNGYRSLFRLEYTEFVVTYAEKFLQPKYTRYMFRLFAVSGGTGRSCGSLLNWSSFIEVFEVTVSVTQILDVIQMLWP